MSMMVGYAWGCYCLGFTRVQISLYLMIVLFLNFFMKSFLVGTHCCHLFDILNSNMQSQQPFFMRTKSKELSDSFYCMLFLLSNRFTKYSLDSTGKKSN